MLVIAVVSLQTNKNQEDEKGIELEEGIFTTLNIQCRSVCLDDCLGRFICLLW